MSWIRNTNVITHNNHKHKFDRAIYISSADTLLVILFTMNSWTTDKKDTTWTVIGSKNTSAPKGFVTTSQQSVLTDTRNCCPDLWAENMKPPKRKLKAFPFFVKVSKGGSKDFLNHYCLSSCFSILLPTTWRTNFQIEYQKQHKPPSTKNRNLLLLCTVCWSLVFRPWALVCKFCTVYFFSINFYSYCTLVFVWVWNKPVSSDEISYSWKFPEQSPSLEHVKGLPMWIMYGELQREGGQWTEELITWRL